MQRFPPGPSPSLIRCARHSRVTSASFRWQTSKDNRRPSTASVAPGRRRSLTMFDVGTPRSAVTGVPLCCGPCGARAVREGGEGGWPGQPTPSLPGARATPAQPASGGGCLPQPRWAVCATGAGAHQGQTSREGERDMWWTVGTTRGRAGHLGLKHTETQRGRLWTACGQRRVDSKNSQTIPATTSAASVRQLLGATDAHLATSSTAPTQQPLGSANAETTPAGAPAAAADRTQRPDATCGGQNG